MINEKQATVISTSYCPYSIKTRRLLERHEVEYNDILLDRLYGEDQMEVANCLFGKESNEKRTVPIVIMGGKRIGGYGELFIMSKNNQLISESVSSSSK